MGYGTVRQIGNGLARARGRAGRRQAMDAQGVWQIAITVAVAALVIARMLEMLQVRIDKDGLHVKWKKRE